MKKQILISLFLLTVFCVTSVFAQTEYAKQEELVTEFVKLKNIPEDRISDNQWEKAFSFRKIIKSVGMYLSPKGEIEIDTRSRTLIISDTPSNIKFVKGVVPAFDYEEIYIPEDEEDKKIVCRGFVPRF